MTRYRAVRGVSTRKSADKRSSQYEEWREWQPGEEISEAPSHMDMDELVKIGAVKEERHGEGQRPRR